LDDVTSEHPKLGPATPLRKRHLPKGLRTRLRFSFLVGSALVAAVASMISLATVHLIDARHTLLDQVDPASLSADQLLLAYVNQETGVRGYGLTQQPTFLQPYTQGLTAQQRSTTALDHSLAGHPSWLRLAHQAEETATHWQKVFAVPAIIATIHHSDLYFTPQALTTSKHLFDDIRASFARLDSALSTQRSKAGQSLNSATLLLIIAFVVGVVLFVAAGLALRLALKRWVTDPLVALGADASQVAEGELSHPVRAVGPTELLELSGHMEAMRGRIVAELAQVSAARTDLDDRNQDLARSNQELEQFAYVASHDLQEPLRKVTSFVQLLQERYEGQLDDKADQYIGFAVDGAKRMQALINDLLAFSRVGRSSERMTKIDLAESLQAALLNLDALVQESSTAIEAPSLPTVKGDPSLLASLWQNLIANSIKFHGEDAPMIRIGVARQGTEWLLSVGDNGIGIEPRFADKVFVIFQRLHGRDAYEGTGIGLAMCKKIVEFHGGRMWLDTTVTTGTTMCFTLPALDDKEHQ
jgi:signal transduction histidine kinase